MGAIQSFQENLQTWGYLLLFLYSFGGGYVAIIAAGFLSGICLLYTSDAADDSIRV